MLYRNKLALPSGRSKRRWSGKVVQHQTLLHKGQCTGNTVKTAFIGFVVQDLKAADQAVCQCMRIRCRLSDSNILRGSESRTNVGLFFSLLTFASVSHSYGVIPSLIQAQTRKWRSRVPFAIIGRVGSA